MEPLPKNYFLWHYTIFLTDFILTRDHHIASVFSSFNIGGLLKNLFAPYRRMAGGKNMTLTDRISFNLISRLVGASVRLLLLLAGLLATCAVAVFDLCSIIFYLIFPFITFPKYQLLVQNTFFEEDLKNPAKFAEKLSKTSFWQKLSLFFESSFGDILKNVNPASLGIGAQMSPFEITSLILSKWPALGKYLESNNIKETEFKTLILHIRDHLQTKPATRLAPLGQILTFGYTNTLDKFSTELSAQRLPPVDLDLPFLEKIEQILVRPTHNNVLLVGEAGVGRHSTLTALTLAIQRSLLDDLVGKRVMLLDSVALAGLGKNITEVKADFEAILAEAKQAGNIILSIDHIDKLVSTQDERIDLSEVLTIVLRDNSMPIVGITTTDEFNQYVRPNTNVLKLFEKVDIEEPSSEETINILIDRALTFWQKEGVTTYFVAILEIVKKSNRLLTERKQPEKSILILEDAQAEAKKLKMATVDVNLVYKIMSAQTKTPLGAIGKSEAAKLRDLETILHQRIIGQDEAIVEIARAMRRARSGVEIGNRPIGSFLFLGPTGVGKTETAKTLAQVYFGAEDRMVRLDMSEFSDEDGLKRLIGDVNSRMPGRLSSLIRESPFSLLLVDEFEKASYPVHNLFLQILDEGFLTDAFGKKVSFTNVIIIATTNAGAEFIREEVEKSSRFTVDSLQTQQNTATVNRELRTNNSSPVNREPLTKKLIDYVLSKGLFNPELINRFDGVVVYQPLTAKQIVEVTSLMFGNLARQLKETQNITLQITPALTQKIAQEGYNPEFGARSIRRLIQDKIEDGIAKMIIEGTAKNGSVISTSTLLKFIS